MLDQPKSKAFARYAWFFVAYTIFVILWGAFVRATGSGAGCGSHWPTCNGEVIPRPETIETFIEFFHRVTSGIMGPMILVMIGWGARLYGWRHRVMIATLWTTFFILVEAAIGAGLVKFELVADNASSERAIVMAAHLVNTFILLAATTLTAWWASGGRPLRIRNNPNAATMLGVAILGLILVSAFGAVTALGDTLFPVESFVEGAADKFDPEAHFSVRARIWHPTLAIAVSAYIVAILVSFDVFRATPHRNTWRIANLVIIAVQIAAGFLNVLLAVPVWMQLVHLFLANLSWIAIVLLTATTLETASAPRSSEAEPAWAVSAGD